ncbi:hypothetical protein JB92DRAFT_2837987 [Gautieria morchelliformis]|nr:hypothetical protein JB92DRAFT_2837987 [Gautieria morchelliformis]
MKMDSRGKEVDLNKWNGPLKLNRKDYRPSNKGAQDEAMIMVGPDGKVPQGNGGKDAANGKGKGKQMFKKKTKQVFLIPEEAKQLRREERYPFGLDTANPEKALTHGHLVPKGPQFQFVPSYRWYKFQKRPTYRILEQKPKPPMEEVLQTLRLPPLKQTLNADLAQQGQVARAVDCVQWIGEDDDMDEMEYEADFADDEENVEMDGDDEETKEMEAGFFSLSDHNNERLEREYLDEDEEEGAELTETLKRLVFTVIQEEEEPEENNLSQLSLNAALPHLHPHVLARAPRPPKPKTKAPTQPRSPPSRANSPGLGNAVVAKRATSPKAPKQKATSGGSGHSRAVSPLAGGSRAASPVPPAYVGTTSGSRLATPATGAGGPLPTQSLKRKASDDPPTPSGAASTGAPDGGKPRKKAKRPLEESMIIVFLREKAEVTTKDCIQKFQPYLKEEEIKKAFAAMVKKVAMVKNSLLKLRPEYQ